MEGTADGLTCGRKEIGFTGDFDEFGGAPMPQFLPEKVPWTWQKVTSSVDLLECRKFYADAGNREGVETNGNDAVPRKGANSSALPQTASENGMGVRQGRLHSMEIEIGGRRTHDVTPPTIGNRRSFAL